MTVFAYLLAVIAWPIVTFGSMLVLQLALMPVFNAMYHPTPGKQASFALADLFMAVVLAASQLLAVLVGKGIFWGVGLQATRWLVLPFALWCLLLSGLGGPLAGRMGRHVAWSWRVGLFGGLALAGWLLL